MSRIFGTIVRMTIRKAHNGDLEELVRLREIFFDDTQKILTASQMKIRAYKNIDAQHKDSKDTIHSFLSDPRYIVFVAEEGGVLRGYICGEVKVKEYKALSKAGYVEHLFVEQEYQKQGIGKKLFERLIEEFKKIGCMHIMLDTHLDNKNAIAFYEHMGFTARSVNFFKEIDREVY
jgi:ribosomal protein S18 acetylase RimI-like enzyme